MNQSMLDKPQRIKLGGKIRVDLYRENEDMAYHKIPVYLPSMLYPFIYQVLQTKVENVDFYLEKQGNNLVFGVDYNGLYDLWTYTPSNQPTWMKNL